MANQNESWFTKWLRNGRLSGLTFGIVFITYIVMTALKMPTDVVGPLLTLFGGVFVANLALRKEQDDQSTKRELEELRKKVESDESP